MVSIPTSALGAPPSRSPERPLRVAQYVSCLQRHMTQPEPTRRPLPSRATRETLLSRRLR